MKKHLIFLLFLMSKICIAQDLTDKIFPDSYLGIYRGELEIYSGKNQRKIPMELHLLKTDSVGKYDYTIVYGERDRKQVRAYSLVETDRENGRFTLDENNGILLEAKVVGNKLYFLFEVMNTLLTTFVTFGDGHLLFEIVTTQKDEKMVSGGLTEELPEVISYPINVVQKAMLHRDKSP